MLREKKLLKNQGGQALIIILLAMSVVLTVVLSSVSRSITEVKTTSYEEEALRAFSAAEAGVEEKLLNTQVGVSSGTFAGSSSEYEVSVTRENLESNASGKQINYPETLSTGETATFWFVSQNDDGLYVCDDGNGKPCWSTNNSSQKIFICYGSGSADPAVEISFYYDDSLNSVDNSVAAPVTNNYAGVEVARFVFDKHDSDQIPGADDADISGCVFDDGTSYTYKAIINAGEAAPGNISIPPNDPCYFTDGCLLFAKVRMLDGSNQAVGLETPTEAVPLQGFLISSEGSAGDSTRKVEVYQGPPEPPDLFDVAVYSMNGLSK